MAMRAVAIGGTAILAIVGLKLVMALLITVLPLLLIGFLIWKVFCWMKPKETAEDPI